MRRFRSVVTSSDELRDLVGEPSDLVAHKVVPRLDGHCRAWIARSPFVLLATSGADGSCDVSPRGDDPGFVQVLDDATLLVPDRPGNRRIDSLRNVLANPHVGLLFLIPGLGETLRVNGRACLVRDEELLAGLATRGRAPTLALAVEVEEAFVHCALALRRSALWDPGAWPDLAGLPSAGQVLRDHVGLSRAAAEIEASLADSYAAALAREGRPPSAGRPVGRPVGG